MLHRDASLVSVSASTSIQVISVRCGLEIVSASKNVQAELPVEADPVASAQESLPFRFPRACAHVSLSVFS
jgi:hypothetical protein